MFEEPIRFIIDIVAERSLGARFPVRASTRSSIRSLAKHYGMDDVDVGAGRVGARRRRRSLRPRRLAADGGVSDEERAGPAHQPGEARLLGRAARAGRSDPAAARRGARAAARRSAAGRPDAPRKCWNGTAPTRAVPPATPGSIRLAWCSKATGRSASGATWTWAAGRSTRRPTFPAAAKATGLAGLRTYIREHREQDFVDNLCRKMLAYALGRTLILSDEPHDRRKCASKLAADDYRFGSLVESIVTSPQFRQAAG